MNAYEVKMDAFRDGRRAHRSIGTGARRDCSRTMPPPLHMERVGRVGLLWCATVVHLVCLVFVAGGPIYYALGVSLIGVRPLFLLNTSLYRTPAGLLFWTYLELQYVLGPLLIATAPCGLSEAQVTEAGLEFSVAAGSSVLILYALLALALNRRFRDKRALAVARWWTGCTFHGVAVGVSLGAMFFGCLTVTAMVLGIGRAGLDDETRLPFKLVGLINVCRMSVAPFLAVLVVDILYDRRYRRTMGFFCTFYVPWLALECYARASRGFLVTSVEMLLVWCLIRGCLNRNLLLGFGSLAVAAILTMPVITELRNTRISGGASRSLFDREAWEDRSVTETARGAVLRQFIGGLFMAKYYAYMDGALWHNNVGEVRKIGGASVFHTRVIDQVPEGRFHSSGSSTLPDGYLLAGVPGTAVVAIGLILFVLMIDLRALGFATATPVALALTTMFMLDAVIDALDAFVFASVVINWATVTAKFGALYVAQRLWCDRSLSTEQGFGECATAAGSRGGATRSWRNTVRDQA